jgi:hypothetical protein
MDLIERAMRGTSKGSKKKGPSDVSPLKDAMREAWDAMKTDNFDKFSTAFESAVKIQVNSDDAEESDSD